VVAVVLSCGVANADTRAVGSDGNLWSIDQGGELLRIEPGGDTSSFDLPDGISAQAIATGPGGNTTIVTRPNLDGRTTVRGVEPNGTVSPSGLELDPVFDTAGLWGWDAAVGGDDTIWVSEGISPCFGEDTGNLVSIDSSGGTTTYIGEIQRLGGGALSPTGPIAVDGVGRAWVEGLQLSEVDCDEGSWGGSSGHLLIDGDEVLQTKCSWGTPNAVVATDGAGWCFGANSFFRMDLSGQVIEFDYPSGWSPPNHFRPGPDGDVWFATLTETNEEGWYTGDWTIASISPQGELTLYPGFNEVLTEKVDLLNDYITLYDWRFSQDDTVWLLTSRRRQSDPLVDIVELPSGESQGLLPSRITTLTLRPPVDPPIDPPPNPDPETFTLNFPKSEIKRGLFRRSRIIPIKVWTSHPAHVRVRAEISHRLARKLGLRGKKSKNLRPLRLGIADGYGIQGFRVLSIKLNRKKAEALAKRPGARVKITVSASSEFGGYFFRRFTRLSR